MANKKIKDGVKTVKFTLRLDILTADKLKARYKNVARRLRELIKLDLGEDKNA